MSAQPDPATLSGAGALEMMNTTQSAAAGADAVVKALHWTFHANRRRAVYFARLLLLSCSAQWRFGESGVHSHFYYVGRNEYQQLGSDELEESRVEVKLIHTFTTYSEHNYYTSRWPAASANSWNDTHRGDKDW